MNDLETITRVEEKQVIERFWETIPPVWHNVRAFVDKNAREKNLTMGGYWIMRGIRHGKDTVSELAQRGHLSRPAISRAVDTLVVKGLVSRTNDPSDRRHVKLSLTEDGEQLLFSLREETKDWMACRFRQLKEQELETLLEAFELLNKSLSE